MKKPKPKKMTIEYDRLADVWEVTYVQDKQTAKRRYGSFATLAAVIKQFFNSR